MQPVQQNFFTQQTKHPDYFCIQSNEMEALPSCTDDMSKEELESIKVFLENPRSHLKKWNTR